MFSVVWCLCCRNRPCVSFLTEKAVYNNVRDLKLGLKRILRPYSFSQINNRIEDVLLLDTDMDLLTFSVPKSSTQFRKYCTLEKENIKSPKENLTYSRGFNIYMRSYEKISCHSVRKWSEKRMGAPFLHYICRRKERYDNMVGYRCGKVWDPYNLFHACKYMKNTWDANGLSRTA